MIKISDLTEEILDEMLEKQLGLLDVASWEEWGKLNEETNSR
jgi:hypothetical protein